MKFIFAYIFLLFTAAPAFAYVPHVVDQKSLMDIVTIQDPTLSETYYGELHDFPHTYEIVATEPFHLFVQVKEPNLDSSRNNIFGIIIKEPVSKGRVVEVARLEAKSASWEVSHEWWSGDSYRNGASLEKDLEPGVYRIEVSTPDNRDKYVLQVGKREEMVLGYFETLSRVIDVKKFYGKSPFRIVESPLVWIPLLSLGILFALVRYRQRVVATYNAILKKLDSNNTYV